MSVLCTEVLYTNKRLISSEAGPSGGFLGLLSAADRPDAEGAPAAVESRALRWQFRWLASPQQHRCSTAATFDDAALTTMACPAAVVSRTYGRQTRRDASLAGIMHRLDQHTSTAAPTLPEASLDACLPKFEVLIEVAASNRTPSIDALLEICDPMGKQELPALADTPPLELQFPAASSSAAAAPSAPPQPWLRASTKDQSAT